MRKELSPIHALQSCEICERTILKGELTEPYLAPDGARRLVCELCLRRAEGAGWIRESAPPDMPTAAPRTEPRPSLRDRFRRWRGENGEERGAPEEQLEHADYEEPAVHEEVIVDEEYAYALEEPLEPPSPEPLPPARLRRPAPSSRDPRHVRAVPTNSQVKVERALELFNASEHHRTVAGLVRTLGEPWVTALPVPESPSEVTLVVAWELSWYQYRIDLGDSGESIFLIDKGQEIHELDEHLRDWNGAAGPDGALASRVVSGQ